MSSCGLYQVVASSEYAFLLALPQPHTPSPLLLLLEIPPPNEADLLVLFPRALLSENPEVDSPSCGCEHFKRDLLKEEVFRLKERQPNDRLSPSGAEGG